MQQSRSCDLESQARVVDVGLHPDRNAKKWWTKKDAGKASQSKKSKNDEKKEKQGEESNGNTEEKPKPGKNKNPGKGGEPEGKKPKKK